MLVCSQVPAFSGNRPFQKAAEHSNVHLRFELGIPTAVSVCSFLQLLAIAFELPAKPLQP